MRWASGKHRLTEVYAWFLARWARRLSWKEVAGVFDASWDSVFRAVEMAVEWGRAHQDLSGIQAIGIDEIPRQRGHRYLRWSTRSTRTVNGCCGLGKSASSRHCWDFSVGSARSAGVKYVCSDMWKP